jgi:hypothetical protein
MGRSVEFSIMRDQQIARWDCSQPVWAVCAIEQSTEPTQAVPLGF